jgi:cation transport regulator ChaB
MPKTTSRGDAARTSELPTTLERSPAKAQRTFAKAHDAAADQYGEGERAHRTAYAALKRSHEKVGDHWEPKERTGPSDSAAATPGRDTGTPRGGVDANASKAHLYELARRLDVPGRSSMSKTELVEALGRANDRASARARQD